VAAFARRAGVPVVTGRPSLAIALPRCNAELCSRLSVDKVESLGCRGRHKVVSAVSALLSFVSGTVEVDGRGRVPLCRAAISSPRVCLKWMSRRCATWRWSRPCAAARAAKSLRWAVDWTVTAMGGRRVRGRLLAPLRGVDAIVYRQRIVVRFARDGELPSTLSELAPRPASGQALRASGTCCPPLAATGLRSLRSPVRSDTARRRRQRCRRQVQNQWMGSDGRSLTRLWSRRPLPCSRLPRSRASCRRRLAWRDMRPAVSFAADTAQSLTYRPSPSPTSSSELRRLGSRGRSARESRRCASSGCGSRGA
jgi:hypothetical protein